MNAVRLSLVLGWGWLALSAGSAQEDASPGPIAPPSQARASAMPWLRLDDLTATRDRPLFTLNRRPPPTAPAVIAAPQRQPKPRPHLALKGIVVEGSATFVLLEDVNSSEPVVVRSGETIGAWRVVAETDHSVALVGEGEEIKLEMFAGDAASSK